MTTASPETATNVIAPRRSVLEHVTQLWRYRELLGNLVRKELKVKYKGSSLGFLWSLLNPAMYLVVFYIAFQIVLGAGIPSFAVFILTGLLAWNFFSIAAGSSVNAIVGNSSLVNKVYFPREILPLAAVGANLVHFALQALVLLLVIAGVEIFKVVADVTPERLATLPNVDVAYLWLLVPALVALLLLTSAFGVFLSCVNVYARDTQHLLELALLAWFWMTPIIYPWGLQAAKVPTWLTLVNPITPIVLAIQRALYGIVEAPPGGIGVQGQAGVVLQLPPESPLWYFRNLVIVAFVATVLLGLAFKLFARLEGNFAEEL
ncbi:MAG TPA: ABC transporter permease [Acidimicrobiales bacterium]|nr:ABC transporter permease [Acidimicrobiales bacterium]